MLVITGITFLRAFMVAALSTYLPTFLREEGAALWISGAALTTFQTSGAVGALSGGSISDLLGRRLVLAASALLSPLLMLGFLSAHGGLQLLSLILLGFAALSVNPVVMALAQETFPENRAFANGIYQCLLFISNALMSMAVGAAGDRFGLRRAFTGSAIAPLLSLALVPFLPRGNRHRAQGT